MSEQNQYASAEPTNYAGFLRRLGASIIDFIIIGGVNSLILFLKFNFNVPGTSILSYLIEALPFLVNILYSPIMESTSYQGSIGKIMVGLRVTDLEGNRITFLRALGRNLAKIISFFILLIGFIMIAFTRKKQGLHDIIAKTLVLKREQE